MYSPLDCGYNRGLNFRRMPAQKRITLEGSQKMPRVELHIQDPNELKLVEGQWRHAIGLVPGEPNEGLVANLANSPARLADYDDSSWEATDDIVAWRSSGLSFIWYRTRITLPESIKGRPVEGTQVLLETSIFGSTANAIAARAPYRDSTFLNASWSAPIPSPETLTRLRCWPSTGRMHGTPRRRGAA